MLQALPPAQVQEAPPIGDRDLTVAGFGGIALSGSVRPGLDHPCFAVLVADSGPTDRNWSSPLLKDPRTGVAIPSHGGRDVAAWLQRQGVGSLRYDKRFATSRKASLDISLEAQVGDLRAVLKAARALPEAAGRRILLVGHGEGALLSLLAAPDADALLLLNMPGQSMARTIAEQIRRQLPEDMAKRNLAYLEAAFQAIRTEAPAPEPDANVHPNMVSLVQSLMAPESLTFVKATLDLDPWGLASRLAIPSALAWGDRDIQCPKPDAIPASYRGRILDLPGANHLLKREERPRSSLSGPEVLRTYGDATPLADLAPLAAWLSSFRQ